MKKIIIFLGNQRYLNEFLKTHIMHLLGNYDEALSSYKNLYDEMNLIKKEVPIHIYNAIKIKYIDVLFLKGKFRTSLKMIDEMIDSSKISLSEKIELYRTKGHIYRFNFMFDEAEKIYNYAYKLIENQPSKAFEGKIYTNLAETLCIKDPTRALEFVEKSIEVNSQLENRIELGKTYAASCMAKANLNDFEGATIDGNRGAEIQDLVGYKSGKLFCNIALLVNLYLQKNEQANNFLNNNIIPLVDDIKVYSFLEVYAKALINNNWKELEDNNDFEWIDIKRSIENISK